MKLVVTIVGKDRVGIIAMVSNILAENNVNILNINQNIMEGFFNMVMIVEMTDSKIKLQELQKILKENGFLVGAIRQPTVKNAIVRLIAKIDIKSDELKKACNLIKDLNANK